MDGGKAKMTPNLSDEPVSQFLRCAFAELEQEGVEYCVERNYEQYPETITGDVDLVVTLADMKPAVSTICWIANELGWRPFVKYYSSQAVHIGFYRDVWPKRFVLTIELFAGGVWRGQQFLSAHRVVAMRQRHNCTWRAHSAHEAIITLIHHLLYNKRVFEKYRRQIRMCAEDAPGLFERELRRPFGRSRARNILGYVKSGSWGELESQAGQMRRAFLLRSLCLRPVRFARGLIGICAAVGSKPEGVVISLGPMSTQEAEQLADAVIELAVRWHIFIPPARKTMRFSGDGAAIVRQVRPVIASGGVAVVLNQENHRLPVFSRRHPPVRVNFHNGTACISIGKRSASCSGRQEELAYVIWNEILKHRSDIMAKAE